MILSIRQTQLHPYPLYDVTRPSTGQLIATGTGQDSSWQTLEYQGNKYSVSMIIKMAYPPVFDKKKLTLPLQLNHEDYGYLYEDFHIIKPRPIFPKGYGYTVLDWPGGQYKIYRVGLGGNGHYLCFYQNEKTVAILHKEMTVYNEMDTYTAYLEDERDIAAVCLCSLWLDGANYNKKGSDSFKAVRTEEYISLGEINTRFDPTFIPRIQP